MTALEIEKTIRSHTSVNGGHESRNYLGMSQISRKEDELVNELINGVPKPTEQDLQRLALGYETEKNVLKRLSDAHLIKPNGSRELVAAWSEINSQYYFKGHTDGEWTDGSLLEIKSTIDSKLCQIEKDGKLPRAHYEQVQCYMRFGNYAQAFVLYFARDTGRILVRRISYNPAVGVSLNQKAQRIIRTYYKQTTGLWPNFKDVAAF